MTNRRKNPNYLSSAKQAYDLLFQAWQLLYQEERRQQELGNIEKEGAFAILQSKVNGIECKLSRYAMETIEFIGEGKE